MSCVANPCKICKNAEFCKYVITSQEALSGLRIGDGNGPFYISIDCKYRNTANVRTRSNDLANITVENKNSAGIIVNERFA